MSHRYSDVLICAIFGIPTLASCQDVPEPGPILDRAIAAHGGEKNISRPRMGVLTGTANENGSDISQEESFDLPSRWKRITSGTFDGKKRVSFDLIKDGKLWQWEEGGKAELVPNQAGAEPYFSVVTCLLRLKSEKVNLSPPKEAIINDQSTIGFRATWDGQTTDYSFDKKTMLLIQSIFAWRPEPGTELQAKTVLGDYKRIDGISLPFRRKTYIKRDTDADYVLLTDFTVTDIKMLKRIDDDVFLLPEK